MTTAPMPWWRTDTYDVEEPLPEVFNKLEGPKGVALVAAYEDGKTSGGWGTDDGGKGTFSQNYLAGKFGERRALFAFEKKQQPFAIVMRSVRAVCVDIDGKNGGLEHAKKLGALPPTLGETSKSGDGYHLFYEVDDEWDDVEGFGILRDRIGIEQGVDIRATGCVFHYPQQRWNGRGMVMLPDYLRELLVTKQQQQQSRREYASKVIASGDEDEILMLQSQLESDLAKDIPAGKRNTTLFAIGQQMREAGIDDWDEQIEKRGLAIGLDPDEVMKLVNNISRY